MYLNPFVSVDIPLEVLHKLADINQIVAFKNCTQDYNKLQYSTRELKDRLVPINGNNEPWEPAMTLAGTEGFISIAANIVPELSLELWDKCKKGEYKQAELLSREFKSWIRFQMETDKHVQAVKMILREKGISGGYVRSPLVSLNSKEEKRFEKIKKEWNLQ